ncbi:lytic transglycosylase domain-containing protein [Pseudodonghicola flavimaris]|uniref:Lytic transglycosylase domain-containing protein n=1 Tax=Pseudodonghicola flavimaris TaxID=3050036 RepID=A0ABT7EWA0_9RHOB|nr:lytic transglycosylase domain-containing protein [Pseudodonghicola flavimaris]MDK3016613.1 lytic transglycosylase domain-containing protein [Pseudodonghicola flavimaris]
MRASVAPLPGSLVAALLICLAVLAGGRDARADAVADLSQGLEAMRKADWDRALAVSGARGSLSRDIIVWHWLRAGKGSAGDVLVFLDRRPDWPGLDWLRRKSEPAFTGEPPERVLGFFAQTPPQTAEGALAQAEALESRGRSGEAQAGLVLAWRTLPMGAGLQALYLDRHGKLLAPHHQARLDRMIWDGNLVSAKQMLPLVGADQRALAEARIGLLELAPGVDGLIAKVPAGLQDDPGLSHARFVWRHRKGRSDDAITLMLEHSTSAAELGEPAAWAQRRRWLAREKLRDGDGALAYRIAAQHQLTPEAGYAYADLEWIAGYAALTRLNDPKTALKHFHNFDAVVETPISRGRAGYWLGRTYAALGDSDSAYAAYASAADQQTSFYGLLAAEKIGRPFDPALLDPPAPPPWRQAAFLKSSVAEAGLLLLAAGETDLGERFLTHLVESLDPVQAAQMGAMAVEMDRPHLAVMIAKRAASRGIVLEGIYYPLHPVAGLELPMAQEMTLAIARRESEFDPGVISGAGARGLMQVMPATAKLMATELGILGGHSTDRLTSDWAYNAKLGANYLAKLAGDFDGNVVLMAAGYNAGPRRPARWIEEYGDPRAPGVDIVDWIENIPFDETRNYVMRVTESLPVYRARLGKTPLPIPFSQELAGSTLHAFAP